jgi:hypothetical protein
LPLHHFHSEFVTLLLQKMVYRGINYIITNTKSILFVQKILHFSRLGAFMESHIGHSGHAVVSAMVVWFLDRGALLCSVWRMGHWPCVICAKLSWEVGTLFIRT